MRTNCKLTIVVGLVLLGTACAVVPTGPTVTSLPGTGKDFEQFRRDAATCREYAYAEVGGRTANQAAVESGVQSAAVGTVVGALAGAALGGHHGAATGAGVGLLFGSVAGAGTAQHSAYGAQRRYDAAYVECMYAKGNRVPVSGNFVSGRASSPPPAAYPPPPPPPPGYPPPPPPR